MDSDKAQVRRNEEDGNDLRDNLKLPRCCGRAEVAKKAAWASRKTAATPIEIAKPKSNGG